MITFEMVWRNSSKTFIYIYFTLVGMFISTLYLRFFLSALKSSVVREAIIPGIY